MWLERSWNYGSCARRLPRACFLALRSLRAAVVVAVLSSRSWSLRAAVVVAASRGRGSFLPLPPGRPDFVSRVPTARAASASRRFASVREPLATRDAIVASMARFRWADRAREEQPTTAARSDLSATLVAKTRIAPCAGKARATLVAKIAHRYAREGTRSCAATTRAPPRAHQHARAPADARATTTRCRGG